MLRGRLNVPTKFAEMRDTTPQRSVSHLGLRAFILSATCSDCACCARPPRSTRSTATPSAVLAEFRPLVTASEPVNLANTLRAKPLPVAPALLIAVAA